MLCVKCSAEQRIEDIYCPNCGALIELPEEDQPQGSDGVAGTNAQSCMSGCETLESHFMSGPIWVKVLVLVLAALVIVAIKI